MAVVLSSPILESLLDSPEILKLDISAGDGIHMKDFFLMVHLSSEQVGVDDIDDEVFQLAYGVDLQCRE